MRLTISSLMLSFALAAPACVETEPPPDEATEDGSLEATYGTVQAARCGGIVALTCPSDKLYCDYPRNTCGAGDQQGYCVLRPTICPQVIATVCGCDGRTYGNECEAHAAGTDVDHEGACVAVPIATCGGITGQTCRENAFCDYPEGTCGDGDQQGQCKFRPDTCPDYWDPVCGCDGNTYSNECDANAAGVDVDHEGRCDLVSAG